MSPPTHRTIPPTELYFVFFATGWVLTSVARDLLPTQAAVTAAHGLGLVAMGAAAGAACYRAPRWQAVLLGLLAAASGLLGPPEVREAGKGRSVLAWLFLGLYAVILAQAIAGWTRPRGSGPGATN